MADKQLAALETLLPQLVPDWQAIARVECVPGSGLPSVGAAALVLTAEKLVVISKDAEVIEKVYYDTILRVREIEFKGLVLLRDDVLVAPNETFGIEVVYNAPGKFERSFKLLTRSANNARALGDVVSEAIRKYHETPGKPPMIVHRKDQK